MPNHRILRNAVTLLGMIALLGACGSDAEHDAVGLLEWERVVLSAEVSEPITAIQVSKGQLVEAGQAILQLDPQRFQARLSQAAAQRTQAAARLAELQRGPRAEEIEEARARLRGDDSDLANAELELQRVSDLIKRKLASQEAVDNARTQRDRALASHDVSRAALQVLLAGTTVEELQQAQAQVAQLDAQLVGAELDLKRLTLRAPRPGRIDDVLYHLGERPPAGATLAVLLAGEQPYARVYVPEPVRSRVTPGSAARVYVDGNDTAFSGRVRMVSSDATFTPYYSLTQNDRSRLSYVAEVVLDDAAAAELPGGVPVRVDFSAAPPATRGND